MARSEDSRKSWCLGAYVWGFAEATLFFIVPDVLLTFAVLKLGPKRSLPALYFAALGALCGVALMYFWASLDQSAALAAVEAVPAVSGELVQGFQAELIGHHPLLALMRASISGMPIKIAAVLAAKLGIPVVPFLLYALLARLFRFLLSWLAAVIFLKSTGALQARTRNMLAAVFWVGFYAFYFWRN